MSLPDDFLAHALRVLGDALVAIIGRAELHLRPDFMARGVARRAARQMRALAVMIRRLIFLMALEVELAPAAPRAAGDAPRTAVRRPRATFRLVPEPSGALPECFRSFTGARATGPVPAERLFRRWVELTRVLNSPDVYAKRLARTIRRWQAAGEPKPHVAPLDGRHRLPVDLGLIATALTGLLNKALGDWPDTG
ncbi:MAG: hypothetical protein R3C13_02800 [Hyphomonas sp.]|uniref:hypothetical protein n=1 Tax=Hyphomonas sp. TaxID=87 RepID=UPI0035296C88